MPATAPKTKKNIWDFAAKLPVARTSPCGLYSGELEGGVKFFVLMLEQLGAATLYSCEGHPDEHDEGHFYVSFKAPLKLARKINNCGFFRVEMERNNGWSIRAAFNSEQGKKTHLRWAADSWLRQLGPLLPPTNILKTLC
jgi:hypothetical protein